MTAQTPAIDGTIPYCLKNGLWEDGGIGGHCGHCRTSTANVRLLDLFGTYMFSFAANASIHESVKTRGET
jgi:hypothetical protein